MLSPSASQSVILHIEARLLPTAASEDRDSIAVIVNDWLHGNFTSLTPDQEIYSFGRFLISKPYALIA
jgi:hypothetical protein